MTLEKLALAMCLSACALSPPPAPLPIDCSSDRAAERYPETCDDDAGEEDASSQDD
jgi:hypothetical protein